MCGVGIRNLIEITNNILDVHYIKLSWNLITVKWILVLK